MSGSVRWPAAERSRLWWSVGCGVAALVVACVWLPVPWSLAMVLVGIVAGIVVGLLPGWWRGVAAVAAVVGLLILPREQSSAWIVVRALSLLCGVGGGTVIQRLWGLRGRRESGSLGTVVVSERERVAVEDVTAAPLVSAPGEPGSLMGVFRRDGSELRVLRDTSHGWVVMHTAGKGRTLQEHLMVRVGADPDDPTAVSMKLAGEAFLFPMAWFCDEAEALAAVKAFVRDGSMAVEGAWVAASRTRELFVPPPLQQL